MQKPNGWTEDRVERLKVLVIDGLSCSEIAASLGDVTRNAVIGKIHRLGLSDTRKRDRPFGFRGPESTTPRPKRTNVGPQVQAINARRAPPRAEESNFEVERQAAVVPLHIGLDDLTTTTCRWPFGDASPFTFCGCRVYRDGPYCAPHRALSRSGVTYGAPSQRFSEEHRRRLSEAQTARHSRRRSAA